MKLVIDRGILIERYSGDNGDYLTLATDDGQIKLGDKDRKLSELPMFQQVSFNLEVTSRIYNNNTALSITGGSVGKVGAVASNGAAKAGG